MAEASKILGIAGSLRKDSYNKSLLRAAQQLCPPAATIEIFDLTGIPLFNQDDEKDLPARVKRLKADIRAADALLFATPEYNYSVPGVLKNAIDWASRPFGESAWAGKPAAIIGASAGLFGSARAQYHLRQICVTLDIDVVNQPEVMLGSAAQGFDAQGQLTDAKTRDLLTQLLSKLITRLPAPLK